MVLCKIQICALCVQMPIDTAGMNLLYWICWAAFGGPVFTPSGLWRSNKKETTLDEPATGKSRVISLNSWVLSLGNLAFCGLTGFLESLPVRRSSFWFGFHLWNSISNGRLVPACYGPVYFWCRKVYLYMGITSCTNKIAQDIFFFKTGEYLK